MSKQQRCVSCGGSQFIDAVDNHGQSYQGCARCVVVWPPNESAINAVKLAHEIANRSNSNSLISHANAVASCDALARAVLAQHEELTRLRAIAWTCTRCGRGDLDVGSAAAHRASCMSRTDDEQCIDELRAALGEALDMAERWFNNGRRDRTETVGDARIAELRKLVLPR